MPIFREMGKRMIGETNIVKRIVAALFLVVIFIGFLRNDSYEALESVSNYLSQKDFDAEGAVSVDNLETNYLAGMNHRIDFINLNGAMARLLNMQGFYSSKGIYITADKYIVSASDYTTTDYEYSETIAFRDFLSQNGINFLYVNEPTKYVDDSLFSTEFGIESYSNRNMDLFLSRIRAEGVNAIDLRDNIKEEELNVRDLFYRTDHHWTVPAGLWATQIMAEGLNAYCGYNIDTTIYNTENYTATEWKNCWLGEQGRLVAETYVGLDDYTELKPNFETSFTFKSGDGATWEGTFDNFVNEAVYNIENDVYENGSWHYSYFRIDCINNNVSDGKVLILCDSYGRITQPFMALGVHEVDSLSLRDYDDSFNLRNYILENGYDTVIVAYAQFMVGAHDDETSSNYRLFTFD